MHIPYEEFERVMSACFDVFSAWDDEYDKLQGLLRDLVKKKREEHLRMVWRVNPAHKRLQGRLDHMRKYVINSLNTVLWLKVPFLHGNLLREAV